MVDSSICPRCNAPYSRVTQVMKLSDQLNKYGRREIVYEAQHKQCVTYDKKTDRYNCAECGLIFTAQELEMQTFVAAPTVEVKKKGIQQLTLLEVHQ